MRGPRRADRVPDCVAATLVDRHGRRGNAGRPDGRPRCPPRVRPPGRAWPLPAGCDVGGGPARRSRGSGPAGRPGRRAGAGGPAGARGRGRTGCPAAAVPRSPRDLAAPGGPHADRARLPGVGRDPRRGRAVGGGRVRRTGRRAATTAAGPPAPARRARGRGCAGAHPGAAASGDRRPGAGGAGRRPGRVPAGHQRRRHGRDRPRGAGQGMAAAAGLAGRRPRGPAHPSPPRLAAPMRGTRWAGPRASCIAASG